MTKVFCDACGSEIGKNYVGERLKRSLRINRTKFSIEVIVASNDTWNQGDICLDCLLKVVMDGK